MFNEITEKVDQLMIKDKTRSTDIERESLFFIIAGSEELWNLQNQIYDFEDHSIKPEVLESGICSSSKTLIKIGFNLYNNYPTDSVLDSFEGLDQYNFELVMHAIRLRLNQVKWGAIMTKKIQIPEDLFLAMAKDLLLGVPITKSQAQQIEDKVKAMSARQEYARNLAEKPK